MWGKVIFFRDVYLLFSKKHKLQKLGDIDQTVANNYFQISLQTLADLQNSSS